jgi:aminopeptidase C
MEFVIVCLFDFVFLLLFVCQNVMNSLNTIQISKKQMKVLVGVDRREGEEARYRIENSHGAKNGLAGFYHASESFLKLYLYEAAICSHLLPNHISNVFENNDNVVHLPPWDPLGALAN